MRQVLCASLGVLLAAAVTIQRRVERPTAPLAEQFAVLNTTPPGWLVRDLPIGDTEAVREAAAKTLRYDSYFYREYRKDGIGFTVFVAYWSPGKHPPQMIAQHVPDRCWTLNGMTCEEMRFNLPMWNEGRSLWPAQWRRFRDPRGNAIYTMFWHIVGGRPFDFGERFHDAPSALSFGWEALKFAAGSRPAQTFFRISASVPPESLWSDAGFRQMMTGLMALGLARPEKQGA